MKNTKENNMVTPSIFELSDDGKYNKYQLTTAVAKCAKMATEEYQQQRAKAKERIENKESDKSMYEQVDEEYRDVRAVRIGIDRLKNGQFVIDDNSIEDKDKKDKK